MFVDELLYYQCNIYFSVLLLVCFVMKPDISKDLSVFLSGLERMNMLITQLRVESSGNKVVEIFSGMKSF